MRKLLKWEEVQEEGRWTVAPGRRAGGFMLSVFFEFLTRKFLVKCLTRNSKEI